MRTFNKQVDVKIRNLKIRFNRCAIANNNNNGCRPQELRTAVYNR